MVSIRLWSFNNNIYAAIQKAYIKVYVPRDSTGYGFQFYTCDPVSSSGSTSLSLSAVYNLFSVTISWADNRVTSYAGKDYAYVKYKPIKLFQDDFRYVFLGM